MTEPWYKQAWKLPAGEQLDLTYLIDGKPAYLITSKPHQHPPQFSIYDATSKPIKRLGKSSDPIALQEKYIPAHDDAEKSASNDKQNENQTRKRRK